MFGDRPGSPRRDDDRQNFDPSEPWPPAAPSQAPRHPAEVPLVARAEGADPFAPPAPEPLAAPVALETPLETSFETPPHEDDVKVAGERTRLGAPASDTLGFAAAPPEQFGTGGPAEAGHNELAAGGPPPRGTGGTRRRGGGAGRPGGGAGKRNGVRVAAIAAGAAVVLGGAVAGGLALSGGSDDSPQTVQPSKQVADAPRVDPKVLEQQRQKLALERASREARQDGGGKGPSLLPKGKPLPTKTPTKKPDGGGTGGPIGDPVPAGEAQQIAKKLMPGFGFTGSGEFGCLVKLWNKESHWNVHAANPSGAYGIPQALPGSKMSSAGPDWQNNATTQIKWGLGYIKDRYKTPCGAWSHSQSVGWY